MNVLHYNIFVSGKQVESLALADVPEFIGDNTVDAYVEEATFADGSMLTEAECDEISDNSDLMYDLCVDWRY